MGSARAGSRTSGAVALLVVLALVLVVWLVQGSEPGTPTSSPGDGTSSRTTIADLPSSAPPITASATPSPEPSPEPTTPPAELPELDEFSDLPVVGLSELPPEAAETIELIDANGPYPYYQDGGTFGNREGLLPDFEDGYYQEFTVETPGSPDRGARRIIEGADGELYWTEDHYQSFYAIYL